MDKATSEAVAVLHDAIRTQNNDNIIRVLKSIIDIAEGSKIQQEGLGSNGACEAIHTLLRTQIQNPHICEYALNALSRMCRREQDQYFTACIPNIARFGDVGICPQLICVMKYHVKRPVIAAASLKAIANMSSMTQSNKTSLREAGCCECVVEALKIHVNNPLIAEQACWVMTFLACDHPENKVLFGQAGACEAVIGAIATHMSTATVLCRACGAAAFLAKGNDVNREHLLELKTIDLAVECLHRFRQHKGLLQVVCHILLYLHYCQYPEKMAVLKQVGALDSRGWVVDMGYDALLAAWNPDATVAELQEHRKSTMGGICSFIICS